MKKSAFSLLLALALVFSMVLAAMPAAQAAEHTDHCVCGGKWTGKAEYHTCQTLTEWKPLDTATLAMSTVLVSGNYYLTEDVQLIDDITCEEGAVVTICLNGKKLMGSMLDSGTRVLTQDKPSTVSICDCSEKQTGKITSNMTEGTGGVLYQNSMDTVTNIYGGTIYGASVNNAGGAFRQNNKKAGVLNMYGGRVTGGHSDTNGGNLAIYTYFNMYGGIVDGGTANVKGGNLYVGGKFEDSATVLYGGAIYNGKGQYDEDIWVYKFVGDSDRGKLVIVNTEMSLGIYAEENTSILDTANMDSSLKLEAKTGVLQPNYLLTKTGGTFVPPSDEPEVEPTEEPTEAPTEEPTEEPTEAPTQAPTQAPTTGDAGNNGDAAPMNPVIWIVIAVAVVAVVAVVVVVVLKKKKA